MQKLMKDKISFIILIFIVLSMAISDSYLIYSLFLLSSIETIIRIIVMLLSITVSLILVIFLIKNIIKRNKKVQIIILIISIILSSISVIISYNINKVYGIIDNMTVSTVTYKTSIVALKENEANTITDITESKKIGMLQDETSVDGYQIPKEIIKNKNMKNEITYYGSYIEMLNALLNDEIEYVFLPNNYSLLFSSVTGLENIGDKTKTIYTEDKNVKNESKVSKKALKDPFTLLLMGVDSETDGIKGSSFNGDSLILVTFNPKNLGVTMLSIPRDTYTPITCFAGQKKNKITHAAWYGETCMINTISKMFDVKIDYFVKINFKGVVSLVDTLGGIEVNVPYSLCESNSNRSIDDMVYVREGLQTLNGEQALALARNRHPWPEYCSKEWTNYNSNDFIRGQNQQLVIKGLTNKLKSIDSVSTFYELLNSISKNMETNMTTENILSFYNVGKDILIKSGGNKGELADIIGFKKLYLSGYDQTIIDYDQNANSGSRLALYNYIPYQGSIKDISKAMKINLGLEKEEAIKSVEFNINTPYEETIIGKKYYKESSIALLPNFIGKTETYVTNYCNKNGIKLSVNKVATNSSKLDGQVMKQDLISGMDINNISKSKGLTITVSEYKKQETTSNTTKKTEQDPINGLLPSIDKKKKTEEETQTTEQNNNPTPSTSNENQTPSSSTSNNENNSSTSNQETNINPLNDTLPQ